MKKNTEVLSSRMALLILSVIVLVVFWRQIFSVLATTLALITLMAVTSGTLALIIKVFSKIFKVKKDVF